MSPGRERRRAVRRVCKAFVAALQAVESRRYDWLSAQDRADIFRAASANAGIFAERWQRFADVEHVKRLDVALAGRATLVIDIKARIVRVSEADFIAHLLSIDGLLTGIEPEIEGHAASFGPWRIVVEGGAK